MSTDEASQRTVLTFDWSGADSASTAVIDAVATASGEGRTEIDPLYDAVDPDALDRLFWPRQNGQRRGDGTRVAFTYADYEVVVSSREIAVRPFD